MNADKAANKLIAIAEVVRPHGVRGGLKVKLYNQSSQLIETIDNVLIGPTPESTHCQQIVAMKHLNRAIVLDIDGCDSKEAAEAYRGHKLWIEANQLPKLENDEYYHHELIGMGVVDHEGQAVGTVENVEETPGNHNLVVKNAGGQRYLIPMIDDAIASVDLENAQIALKHLEGLLDDPF